jgi:hypothetical protein
MEETAQNFEKRFFTDLRFSFPFQNFMSHIEFMKLCQNHWSLLTIQDLQRYLYETIMGVEVVTLPECHAHHQEDHQPHPQQDGHVHRVVVCCWLMPTIH